MAVRPVSGRGMVWFRVLVGGIALLGAIAIFGLLVATKPRPTRLDREAPVLTVRAVTIAPVDVPRIWIGYGSARAMHVADVSAEVAARVIERDESVEPGMAIEKGEPIIVLDPHDFEERVNSGEARAAALRAQIDGLASGEQRWREQAEAIATEREIAKAELERFRDALARDAANITDVDVRVLAVHRLERESAAIARQLEDIPFQRESLRAQLLDQEAALQIARRDLERTRILSPIRGVLQRVVQRPGERVSVGDAVARIVDLSRIEVPLMAPMSATADLRVGDAVAASSDSPGSPEWKGVISRIAPEADAQSRTITLYAEIMQDVTGDPTTLLRPGQFVVAGVTSASKGPRLVVPRKAIDGDKVYVAVSDAEAPGLLRAKARAVRTLWHLDGSYPALDPLETQWTVVEGELEPGDVVIVSNLDVVAAGTRVRVGRGTDSGGDGSGVGAGSGTSGANGGSR